jgi:hypothetical protein
VSEQRAGFARLPRSLISLATFLCLTLSQGRAQDTSIQIPAGDVRARIGNIETTIPLQETECTAIVLAADKPSLPFGEIGVVSWEFAPGGCKPPAVDNPIIKFTAAHKETLELDIYFPGNSIRQLGDFAPLYYRGTAVGGSEIRATFGELTGTAGIAIVDRPRCTGMQISVSSAQVAVGGVSKLLVPDVDSWGVPLETPGTELTPAGCSVADDSPAVVVLDRPDRAQIDRSDIRGVAPGSVGVFAVFAGLTATARFEVIPPPPCDSLTYHVPQIAVGEVTGVAYRGGPYLDYGYRGAPMGQEKICIKPAGAPYFEALNLHASVDRDTGAVTGVSPGLARIGVVHGKLIGIDDFTVTDVKKPCTSFRISYLRYLPFRGTDRPSVAYEPTDCDPPQGLATFSASPIGPVAVSLDGSIFGSAPGKAKVTMLHGQLSAISDDIEVAQLDPCTTMTGSFDPPAISPGRPIRLSVSYGPFPCQPPEGLARVHKPSGGYYWEIIGVEGVDGKERQAWTIATGRSWREDDRFWKDHVFKVPITHGQLSTQVSIPSDDDPCRFGEIVLSSKSVRVGQTIRVEVAVSGKDCAPFPDLLGDGGDGFVSISLDGKAFTVRGIHGGLAWLYGPKNREFLYVESEPCTKLNLTMYGAVISPGLNAYSILSYEPQFRCWRPAGDPTFEIDAPQTVELRGSNVGVIRALEPGIATVTVRHGQLTAKATVEVTKGR